MRVGSPDIISTKNRYLVLENIYFMAKFPINLICTSRMYEQLYKVSFNKNSILILRNGLVFCNTILENGL